MRAERLTDLMNNLSGKKETQVTVTLYDEESESQLKIGRRIRLRPNGQYESTYLMNSKVSTLQEIHEFLGLKNISQNAYNIVMQGDVTRIISMSAVERRKIIDELAGVADFDRKIDQAKEEIMQASHALQQQTILLSEFSDRLEQLKKERDQAVKYSELKGKRNYLERLFREARIKELEEKSQFLRESTDQKSKEKATKMTDLAEISQSYDETEAIIKRIEAELEILNKKDKFELTQQFDQIKEKITKTESGIEFLHKQIADYEKQIERIQKEKKLEDKRTTEFAKQLRELTDKEGSLNHEIDKLTNEHKKIQSQILQKSQSDNFSSNRVCEIQEQLNLLNEKKSQIVTERAIAEQNYIRAEEEIKVSRKMLEEALTELRKVELKVQGSRTHSIQEKLNTANRHLRRLKDELAETENEIKERTSQLYQYQNELHRLEMKKRVSDEHNWGRSIDAVLKSGVKGIHGVLVQLASVPKEYQLALETAAGARLKSIVVDNDDTASRLIEVLRSQNAGRATFLPLNKLNLPSREQFNPDWRHQSSGVVGWAVDLIKCDDIYLPAFAYAFGSTLIVKDITSGRRLMGRYRMVTVQGDLLEKSGAMTGGSSPRESGVHFGSEDTSKAQQALKLAESVEKRIEILQRSCKELRAEIRSTEEEIDTLKSELATLKANEEVDAKSVGGLRSQVENLKQRTSTLGREREQLEVTLKHSTTIVSGLEKQLLQLNDALVKESNRVKDSGLESLINRSQELEFDRKKLEAALRNIESQKAELTKEIEIIKSSVNRGHDDVLQATKFIEETKNKIDEQHRDLENYRAMFTEIESKVNQLTQYLSGLDSQKTVASKQMLELTEKKTKLTENLKTLSQEIAEEKAKLADIEERLSNLKLEVLSSEIQDLQNLDLDEELKRLKENLSQEDVKKELDRIERKMASMEPINMKAIDEFEEVFTRLNEVKERCEGLQKEKEEIENRISSYAEHKHKSFFAAFDDVNKHFQEIFAELSFGHGELILESPEDPFKGGLIIQARPRNKKMQRLESMSGGEKSLTALSFIFALQWHNPAPFYAFDEVDMFLDGLNAERLARMVKKQSSLAQFVVVSLRKPMIQASERAIGVFLGKDGFSKAAGMKSKDSLIEESEKNKEAALAVN